MVDFSFGYNLILGNRSRVVEVLPQNFNHDGHLVVIVGLFGVGQVVQVLPQVLGVAEQHDLNLDLSDVVLVFQQILLDPVFKLDAFLPEFEV